MNPNEKGINCQVEQHSITLPDFHGESMPHFLNYRLGTDQPLCDSTKVVVLNGTTAPVSTVDPLDPLAKINIWPNPSHDFINVLMDKHSSYHIQIVDALGHAVHTQEATQGEFLIDMRALANGIYFLKIVDQKNNKSFVEKVMKI